MILIAAVAVGALAAFALYQYVGGVEDRANEDARLVEVLVVKENIPRGLTGEEARAQGLIVKDEINNKFKPATAVTDLTTITTKVAVADLAAGQVLVKDMFADPVESQITASRRVPTGNVAITVSLDQVRAVAGLLVPGDFVNILVAPENDFCEDEDTEGLAPPPIDPETGLPITATFCKPNRYLYQEVQILFIDQSPIPLPGEQTSTGATTDDGTAPAPVSAGMITFSVPPVAAQTIASVAGNLYLTLLPTDYTPVPIPPLDPFVPVLPGEDANQLTPYGPNGYQEQ